MSESLRYYIAHNGGLKVMENRSGAMQTIAEHFPGVTLEHIIGGMKSPKWIPLDTTLPGSNSFGVDPKYHKYLDFPA